MALTNAQYESIIREYEKKLNTSRHALEKRKQEIRPFVKIDDSFKKIVITGDMSPTYYNDDGVLFMNIFDFLLKPDNLNV